VESHHVETVTDWSQYKFFDVAANLSDGRYKGKYNGKDVHDPDFDHVIERAHKYGVKKFLFASGYLHDAIDSLDLSLKSDDFYTTIGIHPCRANEPFAGIKKEDGE
jgi:TatD DNase family protein